MWSVGLAFPVTNRRQLGGISADERRRDRRRREHAAGKLYAAGAHYVVDTLADLPGVIADINRRLAQGERP